nr:hypothetical protein [Gemmatimonadota bacterium]
MEEPMENPASLAQREQSLGSALAAYSERRRRRRAEDTYFGSADVLLEQVEEGMEERERAQRRIEVLREAEGEGMSRALAELVYDLSRGEGLDPVLGFELVRTGLGVLPPSGGVSNAPSHPATDKYLPEWLGPPTPTDDMLRERMLRLSFRRLRSLLETHHEVEEAFVAFARE